MKQFFIWLSLATVAAAGQLDDFHIQLVAIRRLPDVPKSGSSQKWAALQKNLNHGEKALKNRDDQMDAIRNAMKKRESYDILMCIENLGPKPFKGELSQGCCYSQKNAKGEPFTMTTKETGKTTVGPFSTIVVRVSPSATLVDGMLKYPQTAKIFIEIPNTDTRIERTVLPKVVDSSKMTKKELESVQLNEAYYTEGLELMLKKRPRSQGLRKAIKNRYTELAIYLYNAGRTDKAFQTTVSLAGEFADLVHSGEKKALLTVLNTGLAQGTKNKDWIKEARAARCIAQIEPAFENFNATYKYFLTATQRIPLFAQKGKIKEAKELAGEILPFADAIVKRIAWMLSPSRKDKRTAEMVRELKRVESQTRLVQGSTFLMLEQPQMAIGALTKCQSLYLPAQQQMPRNIQLANAYLLFCIQTAKTDKAKAKKLYVQAVQSIPRIHQTQYIKMAKGELVKRGISLE